MSPPTEPPRDPEASRSAAFGDSRWSLDAEQLAEPRGARSISQCAVSTTRAADDRGSARDGVKMRQCFEPEAQVSACECKWRYGLLGRPGVGSTVLRRRARPSILDRPGRPAGRSTQQSVEVASTSGQVPTWSGTTAPSSTPGSGVAARDAFRRDDRHVRPASDRSLECVLVLPWPGRSHAALARSPDLRGSSNERGILLVESQPPRVVDVDARLSLDALDLPG